MHKPMYICIYTSLDTNLWEKKKQMLERSEVEWSRVTTFVIQACTFCR